MCGIFGYVGAGGAVEQCLRGLKKLEYRGYDSAGIACLVGDGIVHAKRVGKISALEAALKDRIPVGKCAIAHTRWATHGLPTEINAHPHLDESESVAVVHNGIVENHVELRRQLERAGVRFRSDTDSEVIAQLIGQYYQGDLFEAVRTCTAQLRGAWALAITHRHHPFQLVVAAHESPLAVGFGNRECFVSSDPRAFDLHIEEVIYLSDGEIGVLSADGYSVTNAEGRGVDKPSYKISGERCESSKGGFEHYMLKEIFQQPETIQQAMQGRLNEEYGTAQLEGLQHDLSTTRRVLILACGSSWHAGYVASYMIEDLARVPVQCEIGSEFRSKNPIVQEGTLAIAISQSGETADTLAAARELKAKGARVAALCNVGGSTLMRMADYTLNMRAGPEIAVACTKAYTAQLVVLSLLALQLGRAGHLSREEGCAFLEALKMLPGQVKTILERADHIRQVARRYAQFDNFFYVGRGHMYPSALEGALKLKEISYANANGYPAGELKHGVIALINPECPTVACCANALTKDKLLTNLMEIKARSGPIVAIVPEGSTEFAEVADDLIEVPDTIDSLAAIPTGVATQLLAYYIAKERGIEDIDQPRNLAKSVTVE